MSITVPPPPPLVSKLNTSASTVSIRPTRKLVAAMRASRRNSTAHTLWLRHYNPELEIRAERIPRATHLEEQYRCSVARDGRWSVATLSRRLSGAARSCTVGQD